MNARRYYLLKHFAAERVERRALASAWRSKHDAEDGTVLPATLPARSKLVAAGYSAAEDLDGATADELQANAGLTRPEATATLAALE